MFTTAFFMIHYAVLAVWIVSFLYLFRARLSVMAGMTGAMAIGMAVGLGGGTLLTVQMPGQSYEATLWSMVIGGLTGALAGMPMRMIAVLDGLLSGIMSGMMGSMLAAMTPMDQIGLLLKTIAVLCSTIVFLILLMLQSEVKKEHLEGRSLFVTKPEPMFTVIVIFAVVHALA